MSELLNIGGCLPALPTGKHRKKTYPNFPSMRIPVSFQMVVCGMTGTGKTTSFINIARYMGCFHEVYICTKMPDEEAYQYLAKEYAKLEKETKQQQFFLYSDVTEMPLVDSFHDDPRINRLVIFDDMQGEPEKKQKVIESFFTRGRKKNFSCAYLCQNYFGCPKKIRDNCAFALFRSISSHLDVTAILKDFGLGVSKEKFVEMFRFATQGHNFLLVDRFATDPKLRFRVNWGDNK